MKILILSDYVPSFLDQVINLRGTSISDTADFVDEQFCMNDESGEEKEELYDRWSNGYYNKWEVGGFESYSTISAGGNYGAELADDLHSWISKDLDSSATYEDNWVEDESGVVRLEELKFLSKRVHGRLHSGEILYDDFELRKI